MTRFGLFFEITDSCNHRCIHCCKTWRTDCNHAMDKATLDAILAFPKQFLVISGGEPGMCKGAVNYVLGRWKGPTRINTNLTLWTPEELIEFERRGLDLSVSVPSIVRSEFEAITGNKNSYDLLVENLGHIGRRHRMTVIVDEVTQNTAEETVLKLAAMGFWNFHVQPMIPNGSSVDMKRVMGLVERIYCKHRNLNIGLLMPTISSCVPANHRCGAGVNRVEVLSNGDVVPCGCYLAPVLGHILKDTPEDILKRGRQYFDSFSEEDRNICKGWVCREEDKSCFREV